MAKEYVIEKAFQPKGEDDQPKSWESTEGGKMFVWKVKVEGQDFWFNLNKKPGNVITPGDTIYGLFDEETVTPKDKSKEPFTVKKFVKVKRPDGSFDKVQSRTQNDVGSDNQTKMGGRIAVDTVAEIEQRLDRIEEHLGLPPIAFAQDANTPTDEEEDNAPLNPNDLPL